MDDPTVSDHLEDLSDDERDHSWSLAKFVKRGLFRMLGYTSDQIPVLGLFTAAMNSQKDKHME